MREAATLRSLAENLLRLAEQASDEATAANLRSLAGEYRDEADRLEPQARPPIPG